MIFPKDFKLTFLSQKQLTEDVHEFYFKKGDFEFLAGQHIKIFLSVSDPEGSNRSFSISSSPLEEKLMITTHISKTPFKQALIDLKEGAQVQAFGPIGRMVILEEEVNPILMLAGGIGITPFRSMLLFASERKITIPITFFASFSNQDELLFYDELSKSQNPNIKVVYTITQEDQEDWTGEKGRITKDMIEKYVPNVSRSKVFIAGPPKMVEAMIHVAQELTIPPEKILKESFIGY